MQLNLAGTIPVEKLVLKIFANGEKTTLRDFSTELGILKGPVVPLFNFKVKISDTISEGIVG